MTRHSEAPQNTNAASSSRHVATTCVHGATSSYFWRSHGISCQCTSRIFQMHLQRRWICQRQNRGRCPKLSCQYALGTSFVSIRTMVWTDQVTVLPIQAQWEFPETLLWECARFLTTWERFPLAKSQLRRKAKGSSKQRLVIRKPRTDLAAPNKRLHAKKTWKMFRSVLQPRCIESQVFNKFWIPFGCTERTAPLDLSECHLQGRLQSCTPLVAPVRWWKSFLRVILRDKFLKNNAGGKIQKNQQKPSVFSRFGRRRDRGCVCVCILYIYNYIHMYVIMINYVCTGVYIILCYSIQDRNLVIKWQRVPRNGSSMSRWSTAINISGSLVTVYTA